ncbi:hypothetical protein N9M31_06940 [Alphaproteobacteria bacterium]|nr:hypothetical protein [Alphaproteobacteria bacterium]
MGSTARTAASLCGINRETEAFRFLGLREIITCQMGAESEAMFGEEVEVDKNYFGGMRKENAGAALWKKSQYLAYYKKEKVYTKIIFDRSGATLIPIIKSKAVARWYRIFQLLKELQRVGYGEFSTFLDQPY